ncbi:MAG: hypothetical protein K2Q10_12825 [Rhodospirillales bacterium]|nr:hypothetical protein [Rhodospirillales bacterium]
MARTGYRRLSAGHYASHDSAKAFSGLPEGFTHPGQLLQDAERCGPDLPFPAECLGLARVLLSYSSASDWVDGSQPVVWPTNIALADCLGLSTRSVQRQLDCLEAAGVIWRDLDSRGRRIIDLAPLAALAPHLRSLARAADARRRRLSALAREAAKAWAEITMACATLEMEADASEAVEGLRSRARNHRLTAEDRRDERRMRDKVACLSALAGDAMTVVKMHLSSSVSVMPMSCSHGSDVVITPTTKNTFPSSKSTGSAKTVVSEDSGYLLTPPPASLTELRRLLLGALPRLGRILAEHLGHAPENSGRAELLDAAEILRQELGMAREGWLAAIERHGWQVVVAATVAATAWPAEEVRRSRAALLRGMLRKPPEHLRPWPSLHRLRICADPHDIEMPSPTPPQPRLPLVVPVAVTVPPPDREELGRAVAILAAMSPSDRARWYQQAVPRLERVVPGDWSRPSRWAYAVCGSLREAGLI